MEPGAVATRFVSFDNVKKRMYLLVPQMVAMSTVLFDTFKTFLLVRNEMDLKVGEK